MNGEFLLSELEIAESKLRSVRKKIKSKVDACLSEDTPEKRVYTRGECVAECVLNGVGDDGQDIWMINGHEVWQGDEYDNDDYYPCILRILTGLEP